MTASARDRALGAYVRMLRRVVSDDAPASLVVRALASTLVTRAGIRAPWDRAPWDTDPFPSDDLLPLPDIDPPWLLGQVHEALLDPTARRRAGAHYTPPDIARRLVAFARLGHGATEPRAVDPAAGGGAFLLAVAESLDAEGVPRVDIVRRLCFGGDIDPVAVDVTRAALALWAGAWPAELDDHVVVRDALGDPLPRGWGTGEFDLVVGNPPFQSQLGAATARTRDDAARLRERFGDVVSPYVDSAALFLLAGLDLLAPGGRLALVQPHSTLVARDATAVRQAVTDRADLRGVWFAAERVFAAGVRVWAPVVERPGPVAVDGERARCTAPIERRVGAAFLAAPAVPNDVVATATRPSGWAPLVSDLTGVPQPKLRTKGCVRDVAAATAGFRDQFYGLVGAVREHDGADAPHRPRLFTSGLVELLDSGWGHHMARFAGARYLRPVVDLGLLSPQINRWVAGQLVPKLVMATQTRVLEVAVDEQGDVVPSTPVIAVHAPAESLWHLAAALSAPPVTALAMRSAVGAALSSDAVKLSARQVLELPLPADHDAWDDAARLARCIPSTPRGARRRALAAFGEAGCAAYGVAPGEVLEWWLARIPGES